MHQQKQRVLMQVLLGVATQLQSKQVFRVKMSHFQYTTCITRLAFCNVASFALKNVLECKLQLDFMQILDFNTIRIPKGIHTSMLTNLAFCHACAIWP